MPKAGKATTTKPPKAERTVKRGRWDAKETTELVELVNIYDLGNWECIASSSQHLRERTGMQLKDRWRNLTTLRKGETKVVRKCSQCPTSKSCPHEDKNEWILLSSGDLRTKRRSDGPEDDKKKRDRKPKAPRPPKMPHYEWTLDDYATVHMISDNNKDMWQRMSSFPSHLLIRPLREIIAKGLQAIPEEEPTQPQPILDPTPESQPQPTSPEEPASLSELLSPIPFPTTRTEGPVVHVNNPTVAVASEVTTPAAAPSVSSAPAAPALEPVEVKDEHNGTTVDIDDAIVKACYSSSTAQ